MAKKLMSFEKSEIDLGKPELPRVYRDSNLYDFITEKSCCCICRPSISVLTPYTDSRSPFCPRPRGVTVPRPYLKSYLVSERWPSRFIP